MRTNARERLRDDDHSPAGRRRHVLSGPRRRARARRSSDLLAGAPALDVPPPKAVILPHAGYRYSGAVAAAGAVALQARRAARRRAGAVAPLRLPGRGAARCDRARHAARSGAGRRRGQPRAAPPSRGAGRAARARSRALDRGRAAVPAAPAGGFLGACRWSSARSPPTGWRRSSRRVWGGDETLIVVSTDLTHFLTAERGRAHGPRPPRTPSRRPKARR